MGTKCDWWKETSDEAFGMAFIILAIALAPLCAISCYNKLDFLAILIALSFPGAMFGISYVFKRIYKKCIRTYIRKEYIPY